MLHYKEFSADEVWLPPVTPGATPLVTDPQGIEIFARGTPPPDPEVNPPVEAEFAAVV